MTANHVTTDAMHYEYLIPHNSPLLTPAVLGQSLGIEFDTTSIEYSITEDLLNATNDINDIAESWAGIDNVVFEITGLTRGDLNGDGFVNATDAANLVPNLQAYTPFEASGELTGDNFVNLNDFRAQDSHRRGRRLGRRRTRRRSSGSRTGIRDFGAAGDDGNRDCFSPSSSWN